MIKHFATRIIQWQQQHGRQDLPWQTRKTPYRVWISEIMLQQTQVSTVIPYFKRFMRELPSIKQLANAPADQVMSLWSGLGYYSRARNLHKAAQHICQQHDGRFPRSLELIMQLPGIGRSTAGAIASLAMQQPTPILDGNVKRVMMRSHAISGWYGQSAVLKQLWQLSESLTPKENTAIYNQGLMDLGAMICTRSKPSCDDCPLQTDCQSYLAGTPTAYPESKPKMGKKRSESRYFLLIHNQDNELLLYRRPEHGIWGGLWSIPECPLNTDMTEFCQTHFGFSPTHIDKKPSVKHLFSHYQLNLHPIVLSAPHTSMDLTPVVWYKRGHCLPGGIAAPIEKLINEHQYDTHDLLQTA